MAIKSTIVFPIDWTTKMHKLVINEKFLVTKHSAVKPAHNDHPWDPKIVAVIDRWSLLRGHLCSKSEIWDLKMLTIVDTWSLFGGGR
jgi:hypothetical protein